MRAGRKRYPPPNTVKGADAEIPDKDTRSALAALVGGVQMHTSSLSTPLMYEAFTLDRSAVSGKRTARAGKSVDRSCWWYLRQSRASNQHPAFVVATLTNFARHITSLSGAPSKGGAIAMQQTCVVAVTLHR